MARRANRRKKAPSAAIPTYREDSKTTSGPDPKLAIIALLLVVLLIGSGLYDEAKETIDDMEKKIAKEQK